MIFLEQPCKRTFMKATATVNPSWELFAFDATFTLRRDAERRGMYLYHVLDLPWTTHYVEKQMVLGSCAWSRCATRGIVVFLSPLLLPMVPLPSICSKKGEHPGDDEITNKVEYNLLIVELNKPC